MIMNKLKISILALLTVFSSHLFAENEPWQNPKINAINREPMSAHFIPFVNEAAALVQQSLISIARCMHVFGLCDAI